MRANLALEGYYKSLTTNSVAKYDISPKRIMYKDWSPAGINALCAAVKGVQAIWR